jgi:hypothetical protein
MISLTPLESLRAYLSLQNVQYYRSHPQRPEIAISDSRSARYLTSPPTSRSRCHRYRQLQRWRLSVHVSSVEYKSRSFSSSFGMQRARFLLDISGSYNYNPE